MAAPSSTTHSAYVRHPTIKRIDVLPKDSSAAATGGQPPRVRITQVRKQAAVPNAEPVALQVRLRDRKAQPLFSGLTLTALGTGALVMIGLRQFVPPDAPDNMLLPRLLGGWMGAGIAYLTLRTSADCTDHLKEQREERDLKAREVDGRQQLALVLSRASKEPLNAKGLERTTECILALRERYRDEVTADEALNALKQLAREALQVPASASGDINAFLDEVRVIAQAVRDLKTDRLATPRACKLALEQIHTDLRRQLQLEPPSLRKDLARLFANE